MNTTLEIDTIKLNIRSLSYQVEYFCRKGSKGTILFVHGLGGCKENFLESTKCHLLDGYELICFDNPGTGASTYYEDAPLDVDDLVFVLADFIKTLQLENFVIAGASMGGLMALLYLARHTETKVVGLINIEGNLMPEDCMFSAKIVQHDWVEFEKNIFVQSVQKMRNQNPGYHIISNNLTLNTNVRSYYNYAFQTVRYSHTGDLLTSYINVQLPKVFIYGEKNKGLSYLPVLRDNHLRVEEVADSDHFIFYDNPVALYSIIAQFISAIRF